MTEHNLTVAQLDEAERAVFVIKRGPQTRPVDVVSNVRSALKFVGEQVLPSSGLEGREGFLLSLGRAAFQLILDKVLIPSMPHSLDGISDWLQLVRKSAEWEQELCSSPDSPGMLQQFLQIGAGKAWLDQRRVDTLRQTRHLVYHDWKTWNSKSVDDLFETVSPQEVPLGEVSSNGKAAAQETDGMATDQNSDMADDDGWNFDDFEVVTSQPVRAPTKPVREAKRLGRKAAQKSLAPEQRIGAEDSEVEPAPVKPASHQPANNPASIPPASEKKTYQVSVICDRVVAVVSDAVGDMKRLADLL